MHTHLSHATLSRALRPYTRVSLELSQRHPARSPAPDRRRALGAYHAIDAIDANDAHIAPGSTVRPGPRGSRRSALLAIVLVSIVSLAGACSDSATPITAAPPPAEERAVPPSTRMEEHVESDNVKRSSIDALERDLDARPGSGVAWTVGSNGAARHLTASQLRNELRSALDLRRQYERHVQADSAMPQSFASPLYSAPKLSITAFGVAKAEGSHFHFYSISVVNRMDRVFHRMRATTKVLAVGENGAQTDVYSRDDSTSFYETGGIASHAWDEFVVTDGCSFMGSTSTSNAAHWPATGYVPSGIVDVASGSGGGTDTMWKSCSKPSTPPPAPPSEPLCDDDTSATCEPPRGGGTPPYSGGPMNREVGHTARHKIICEVTDWYDHNGVFIETTINRCWTEPIW